MYILYRSRYTLRIFIWGEEDVGSLQANYGCQCPCNNKRHPQPEQDLTPASYPGPPTKFQERPFKLDLVKPRSYRNIKASLNAKYSSSILRHRLRSDFISAFWHCLRTQWHRWRTYDCVALLYTWRTGAVEAGHFIIVICRTLDCDRLEHIDVTER